MMGACVLRGRVMRGATRMAFLALGLTLPGLLMQDSWRFSFFASAAAAMRSSTTDMDAVLIPALALLRISGHANVFWFVFAWGAAARWLPRPGRCRRIDADTPRPRGGCRGIATSDSVTRRRHRQKGSCLLRNYGVGLSLGLAAVGYVQAANTFMGPFMVIYFG